MLERGLELDDKAQSPLKYPISKFLQRFVISKVSQGKKLRFRTAQANKNQPNKQQQSSSNPWNFLVTVNVVWLKALFLTSKIKQKKSL